MRSYISRFEEIQKKIHLLHDRGEREQKLFDSISAEHPELSAEEVVAYVQSKVDENEPNSITYNGHSISVGDYVETINDPNLLAHSERGHFAQSAMKEIYLGEKGKITRIWNSFQGKPAVELSFADDAEKMFFLDCIDFGDSVKLKETASFRPKRKASLLKEKQSAAPPPVSLSLQWNDVIQLKSGVSQAPNAKPVEAQLSSKPKLPASPVNTHIVEKNNNSSTDKEASAMDPLPIKAVSKKTLTTSHESPAVTFHSIGLVKEAFSDQQCHIMTSGKEELGKPLCVTSNPKVVSVSHDIDNLAQTPRPDFLNMSSLLNGQFTPFCSEFVSQVPLSSPPDYCPKFSMDDSNTHIPRYKSATHVKVKRFWIAGYNPDKSDDLQFSQMTIHPNMDSLEVVLAAATKALRWKTMAKRFFSDSGAEIMWADAILDNSRLIATTGSNFYPSLLKESDSQIVAMQTSNVRNKTHSLVMESEKVHQQHQALPLKAREERSGAPLVKQSTTPRNKTPGSTNCSPSVSSASTKPSRTGLQKPILVHVYENGNYESNEYERAYRTIAIRSTYRTLHSVRTLITRELEWKHGMKVEILFDASGAEILSLDQLCDGAFIIASAGDRFIIPYPTSSLHKESMKFSRKTFSK
ncbi:unnamed protein product [Phytomonas sp. Hart1]|nr:unnamed protein product [Phytomonas sp. Hart1]|eukprot:CCW68214.1 unnamed protein product [Phytomonas sp. isolate Hart1]